MEKLNFIEKFKGRDFHTWQLQMQLHLIEKDLWDVKLNSVSPIDANELAKWTSKNKKALGTIDLGLLKAYLHHVDFTKLVKEIGSH